MPLKKSKIITIKIGSSLLVDKNKKVRKKWLSSFARDIQKLKSEKLYQFGAIFRLYKMNYNKKNLKLDKSQAIASIGQIELMNSFYKVWFKYFPDFTYS